jgi:hypothetical protein
MTCKPCPAGMSTFTYGTFQEGRCTAAAATLSSANASTAPVAVQPAADDDEADGGCPAGYFELRVADTDRRRLGAAAIAVPGGGGGSDIGTGPSLPACSPCSLGRFLTASLTKRQRTQVQRVPRRGQPRPLAAPARPSGRRLSLQLQQLSANEEREQNEADHADEADEALTDTDDFSSWKYDPEDADNRPENLDKPETPPPTPAFFGLPTPHPTAPPTPPTPRTMHPTPVPGSVGEMCVQCPAGTTTKSFGSSRLAHCVAAQTADSCPAGFFYTFHYYTHVHVTFRCRSCPKGKWSGVTGASKCYACPVGRTTAGFGATAKKCDKLDPTTCPAGYFYYFDWLEGGRFSCAMCPRGKFNYQPGSASCRPCGAGFTTARSGSLARSSCRRFCADVRVSSAPAAETWADVNGVWGTYSPDLATAGIWGVYSLQSHTVDERPVYVQTHWACGDFGHCPRAARTANFIDFDAEAKQWRLQSGRTTRGQRGVLFTAESEAFSPDGVPHGGWAEDGGLAGGGGGGAAGSAAAQRRRLARGSGTDGAAVPFSVSCSDASFKQAVELGEAVGEDERRGAAAAAATVPVEEIDSVRDSECSYWFATADCNPDGRPADKPGLCTTPVLPSQVRCGTPARSAFY